MKTLYEQRVVQEITERINKLRPEAQRQWGKMNAAQMLAHCCAALEVATGRKSPPRIFMGRILAPFIKKSFLSEQPFKPNYPTDKSFVVMDERDFEGEKKRLLGLLNDFSSGGSEKCTSTPHSFFGKLSPEEWGWSQYKHLDHHLRQFGV